MVIEHEIDLSLTESLIPTTVHVKQFDSMARKIRCRIYKDSLAYTIPDGVIVTCYGTRPDGRAFQYGSDISPELIYTEDGTAVITITDYMTEVYGRFPVDISLISDTGDVLSTFCLVLKVEASAVKYGGLATLTYTECLRVTVENVSGCFITEDGYFGVYSNNGLDLPSGSYSPTVEMVKEVIEDGLLETTVNDEGVCVYETDGDIPLDVSIGADGEMIVLFGKDAEE